MGRGGTAIELAERAIPLSPFDPMRALAFTTIAVGHQLVRDHEAAVAVVRRN